MKPTPSITPTKLRHLAEAQVRKQQKQQRSNAAKAQSTPLVLETDSQRQFHELQVHQVELEMQNIELQKVREELEATLEQYTDLYDFAPVGYFTLAPDSTVQQVNLTGASLVEIERSRLVGRRFDQLVTAAVRPTFRAFLQQVFVNPAKQSGDFDLLHLGQSLRTVNIKAQRSLVGDSCRVAVVDVTERRRAEDKVRVSEIRYRRLFEAAHDGVLLMNPATRKITDANPFMTQLLGYPHDQLVGKEMFEIGLLKDEAASQEMFRNLKSKHEVRYENLPLKSKTGRHQEVEVVANLYQENGHSVIQCNVRDITARKQAEEELHSSHQRMHLATEATGVAIWEWNVLTNRIRWDAEMFRIYGVAPTPDGFVTYKTWSGKVLPEDLAVNEAVLQDTVRRRGQSNRTFRIRRGNDGEVRNLEAVETVRTNAQGQAEWVVGTNLDITARKQAEDMLRASEERFRAAVGAVSSIIWTNNAEGLMEGEQPGWASFTGQTLKQYQGYGWAKAVHPKDAPATVAAWKRAVAKKSVFEFEHRIRRRDGEWRLCSVCAVPLLGEDGAIREWVGVHTDITERKQVEETQRRMAVLSISNLKLEQEIVQRLEKEKSLKQSDLLKSQMLEQSHLMQNQLRHLSRQVLHAQEEERKRISRELHDVIAQTLTGINTRLAALKNEAVLDHKGFDRSITRTQKLVEHSVDIVHEFARELRPAMLDDLGLIPALHSFVKIFSNRTQLHVDLKAFAGVEQLDSNKRTMLYRVAQEALTNIARHAKASRVKVSIQKHARGIRMKISDDGKSFDVERALLGNGGKRLGLVGMRERVEMVGGKFTVISAPGQGTTIIAQIPVRKHVIDFYGGGGGATEGAEIII